MPLRADDFLKMSQAELNALFTASPPGEIPNGDATGTGIALPGTVFSKVLAWFVRWFVWQGKVIDGPGGQLINRVTPFSLKAIRAKVYKDKSWLDGLECIVIDYSKTSFVAKAVRDEIREVAPGLYLGKVFLGKTHVCDFSVATQYQPARKFWRRVLATVGLLLLILAIYFIWRVRTDRPRTYADNVEHFKYGSTGGERANGIPLAVWHALPTLFAKHFPEGERERGWAALGFLIEPGAELPIGMSRRNYQGLDRVFLNCAVCHTGSVRDSPDGKPRIIAGMPANTFDIEAFQNFLFACATDENFTAERIVSEIKARGTEDPLNRVILKLYGVPRMRQELLTLRSRFLSFTEREAEFGPGRVDTFNPPKVLLNFNMASLPEREWAGVCDLPSIWNQAQRKGMWLHWDGNNDSVEERNRSAAFGTGALPPTLDRPSLRRMEKWLETAKPPSYPYALDKELAAKGAPIYRQHCAKCHGASGSDFAGELVGQVTPINEIKTDPGRLDSYSYDLCVNQNLLYAAYPADRFQHFRKTNGYANQPLDGIWLRAPYLHNGSVPTLRDLLEPADKRPAEFYRGYDVYNPQDVGFVSNVPAEGGHRYFKFDTKLAGNKNTGHEGPAYGTELPADEKDALLEYLKTF